MAKNLAPLTLARSASPALRVPEAELPALQARLLNQIAVMRQLRKEESLRGLLVGVELLRMKESMAYGTFGPWVREHMVHFGPRYGQYMMKLALVFLAAKHVSDGELLAQPDATTALAPAGLDGAQRRFVEKALKFVGSHSLSELFEAHGIRETKALGGAREKGEGEAAAAPDAEQLYLFARDEIGGVIERAETLFLKENRLRYLTGKPEEIRGVVAALRGLADKVEAAAKPLLAQTVNV